MYFVTFDIFCRREKTAKLVGAVLYKKVLRTLFLYPYWSVSWLMKNCPPSAPCTFYERDKERMAHCRHCDWQRLFHFLYTNLLRTKYKTKNNAKYIGKKYDCYYINQWPIQILYLKEQNLSCSISVIQSTILGVTFLIIKVHLALFKDVRTSDYI